jgi:hypothetical protein
VSNSTELIPKPAAASTFSARSSRYKISCGAAPNMRPASDFLNAAIFFIKPTKSGEGVRLQPTTKSLQVPLRMFALTIRRVGEPNRCCCSINRRAIIPHVRPQSSRLRPAIPGRQHRYRRVVSMKLDCSQYIATQNFDQRIE